MDESENHMDDYAKSLPEELGVKQELPEPDEENLEFLKFLKSFSEVPSGSGSSSGSGCVVGDESLAVIDALRTEPATFSALQPELAEVPAPSDMPCPAEPEPPCKYIELQLHESPPNALLEHTFLHKLHLLASSEQITFVRWTSSGPGKPQLLQLDYIGLQDHLCGEHSIFHCANVLQFTRHLLALGFKRLEERKQQEQGAKQGQEPVPVPEQEQEQETRPQLYYSHENFQCNQPEKLLLLQQLQAQPAQPEPPKPKRTKAATLPDAPALSKAPLHLARSRFQTLLSYNNHVRLLQQQEPNSEQLMPRRGRTGGGRQATQMLTPSLAAKQVNPSESVLHFGAGKIPEYAGFYGRVEQTLIGEFFAEYLPRYGSRTIGYKDIVVDAGKANAFQQNLPIGIVFSDDEEDALLEQPLIEARKTDDSQPLENCLSIAGDMELEQVMQELCGVVTAEQTEEDLLQQRQNDVTTPELKLQLKRNPKSSRKSAERNDSTAEAKSSFEHDPVEDLIRSDESKASEKPGQEQEHEEQDSHGAAKRRRYHLRNSKSKRSL